MAQQTMHRYAGYFKYSDAAVKAMTENPQDRAAQVVKLYKSFGGKMENIYWFPTGGEYDGMVIGQLPDDVTVEALGPMVRSLGNTPGFKNIPLMTSEECALLCEGRGEPAHVLHRDGACLA